jgi:hypothetical protein
MCCNQSQETSSGRWPETELSRDTADEAQVKAGIPDLALGTAKLAVVFSTSPFCRRNLVDGKERLHQMSTLLMWSS